MDHVNNAAGGGGGGKEGWKLRIQRQDGWALWKRKPTKATGRTTGRNKPIRISMFLFCISSVDKEESKKFNGERGKIKRKNKERSKSQQKGRDEMFPGSPARDSKNNTAAANGLAQQWMTCSFISRKC